MPDRFSLHINQTGEEIKHKYKPGKWKHAIALKVLPDKILWFHKDDLELVCVYCTDCVYFSIINEIPHCPFESKCDLNDCEDSKSIQERPLYYHTETPMLGEGEDLE